MGKGEGKRVALLVGCNYPGTQLSLRGCINDANSMRDLLVRRFDFKPNDVTVFTDEKGNRSELQPTGANIRSKLNHLAACCTEPDDLLLFFFSGHGYRENYNFEIEESISPTDWNLITKYDFRNIVNKMRNATFLLLSDSCNSGGLIDKEELQICHLNYDTLPVAAMKSATKNGVPKGITPDQLRQVLGANPNTRISDQMTNLFGQNASLAFLPRAKGFPMRQIPKDKGILFSACRSEEIAYDLFTGFGSHLEPHGAFTLALIDYLQGHINPLSNKEVVEGVAKLLFEHKHNQHPCLYCTKENVPATFLLQQHVVSSQENVHSSYQKPVVWCTSSPTLHQPDLLGAYSDAVRVPKYVDN